MKSRIMKNIESDIAEQFLLEKTILYLEDWKVILSKKLKRNDPSLLKMYNEIDDLAAAFEQLNIEINYNTITNGALNRLWTENANLTRQDVFICGIIQKTPNMLTAQSVLNMNMNEFVNCKSLIAKKLNLKSHVKLKAFISSYF